jgi:hypothetical protein
MKKVLDRTVTAFLSALLLLIVLFPPWVATFKEGAYSDQWRVNAFIATPPAGAHETYSLDLALLVGRLLVPASGLIIYAYVGRRKLTS